MSIELMKKNKHSVSRRILKWMRNLFIMGLAGIVLTVTLGMLYEKSSEYKDIKKYSPPGKTVEVNGHDMHIYAEGSGKVTVVFASGWGVPCPYADFYPLYSKISNEARIAVYDRPGYGWSSVCNTPRDIDTIVKEMHELLIKSGEKPPYILVGHSLGSLEVIRFAQLYKDEVEGIVLLDGGNPEYYANETTSDQAASSMKLKSILSKLGVIRILFNKSPGFVDAAYSSRNDFSLEPGDLKELDKALYLKNMVNKNKTDEMAKIKVNASKVLSVGSIGSIPLAILTSGDEAEDLKWKDSQEALKDWSMNSYQKTFKGVNHNMHQYIPDVISEEILNVLLYLIAC